MYVGGNKTPMHGSQTPLYEAGSRTPHAGSMTPAHDGSRTPGHGTAWDSNITNTPARYVNLIKLGRRRVFYCEFFSFYLNFFIFCNLVFIYSMFYTKV